MRLPLAPALAALLLASAAPALAADPLFIEDDWPGALARAKERSVPIVVDVWAPW